MKSENKDPLDIQLNLMKIGMEYVYYDVLKEIDNLLEQHLKINHQRSD